MMDYLSEFPGPSKDAAIRYVIREIQGEPTHALLDEHALYIIVSTEYDAMGPIGSQACWISVTANVLIAKTKVRLRLCEQKTSLSVDHVLVFNPDNKLMIGKIK
jgi:hypothetical protein